MEKWICKTCGTQFPASEKRPEGCPICLDERQYVGYNGQEWTTLAQMREDGFRNEFREHELHLIGIGTTPTFAIGERALLVQSAQGNVLWDCMSLLDDETAAGIERLGGLTGIAISHPHYYSTTLAMVFGSMPCSWPTFTAPSKKSARRLSRVSRSASYAVMW